MTDEKPLKISETPLTPEQKEVIAKSAEPAQKAMAGLKKSMEKAQPAIKQFYDEFGDLLHDYKIYCLFFEEVDCYTETYNLFTLAEMVRDYIEKYEITEAPTELSQDEQTRIIDFIKLYEKSQAAEKPISKRKQAEESGAITTMKLYALTITDKNFKHALSPYKNTKAYIEQLDSKFIQNLNFNPKDGTIRIKDQSTPPIKLQQINTLENIKELDLQLLRSLYTIIYSNAKNIGTDTVSIFLPTLLKHLGIEINTGKPNDLFKKIRSFENVIGVYKNGSFYKLLDFIKYEKETNIMTFASPWMNKILRELESANTIKPKKGDLYIKPHHGFLVHSNIAKERNKPAIEIVQVIVALLQERAEDKRENVQMTTAHIKISTIIERIPLLNQKLDNTKTIADKNRVLKRAFSKTYELLKTRTDLYTYYNNLTIPEIVPTVSIVDQVINITHSGINKDYHQL